MDSDVESIPEGYIVDYIDDKPRKDTPEEYVRQNVEKRLVNEHKYSSKQIAVELPIIVGSSKKRIDIGIFSGELMQNQENIQIIIECKNENVEFNNRKDGIDQLKSYMAACLNCEWGMWTNGKTKFVFRKTNDTKGKLTFDEYNDIPSKDRDISEIDRPKRDFLQNATEDNLLYSFRTCHNHIYVNDGLHKSQAFFEFLKIIFCKILDERNYPHSLEFYASSKEKMSLDGQLTVKNRISKIFEKVKKRYSTIFDSKDEIELTPVSLSYVIAELQKYSFLDTNIDVKGKAYEEIVGSNLRGDRGEFFTPRNIARMVIQMLDIPLHAKILDPACGTGGFLVIGMNNVIRKLKEEVTNSTNKKESQWSDSQKEQIRERIKEIASQNFFGVDINPGLVKATKMNMVMNNDGSGNILKNNTLLPPHEWNDEVKDTICKQFNLKKGSLRNHNDLALFDVVVTNPPFGTKLPIKDPAVLEQYDLGHIWSKNDNDNLEMSNRIVTSRAPEVLFIERCWQFLKPKGIMAIVLPNALLGAPGTEYASVREWILQKCKIIASISLHVDTFQPHNGTQTSVLILQKKTSEEIIEEKTNKKTPNYDIFFGIVDKVGHDKRGNYIYKKDDEGNEILTLEPEVNDLEIEQSSKPTKKRILDDQTQELAKIFLDWKKKEGLNWEPQQ